MLWLVRVEHALHITWGDAKIKLRQNLCLRYLCYSTLSITNYIVNIIYKQESALVLWNNQKQKQTANCSIWFPIWTFQLSFYYDGTGEGIPQKYEIMYGR